jgi:hypothetical protein
MTNMRNESNKRKQEFAHQPPNAKIRPIDIESLEHDFRVCDAYVGFSAEIVRLALLTPTAMTSLVLIAGKDSPAVTIHKLLMTAGPWLISGLCILFVAVALGLIHRYAAADFMSTYIERLRGRGDKGLKTRLRLARRAIFWAPIALALGTLLLGVGICIAAAQPVP